MNAPRPLINPGTILAGRWQIQDFIGSGETGEVYGVRDMHSTGSFALKLFWPNALAQSDLWSAVQQTARTASGLGVDGVARTHDFGIDANSARPFYVAERVAWASLADRVRQRGPLSPAEMTFAFLVLARALDAAHGIGLVHRDLKPENVFVAPENANWVRISDFGVALLRAASPPPPGWGGTAGWVAPDAADPNARSTPAMDIYALGLITFFALTGGALHRAARVSPIDPNALWQELGTPLDSAAMRALEFGAALDPAFDAWFQRALAPNPQARFNSVGEMASAFEAVARNLGTPLGQNTVAVPGVAAAIAQPLLFQPEAPPPAAAPPPPLAAALPPAAAPPPSLPTVPSAQYEPRADVNSAPPPKKRSAAPFFIAGAVLCFGLTALGATALYRHHQATVAEASAEPPTLATSVSAAVPAASVPAATAAATPAPIPAAAAPAPAASVAEVAASATATATATAKAPATPAAPTAPAKAAVAATAKTPVVTPGPAAPKTAASAAKPSSATAAAATAKPTTATTAATTAAAKPKPPALTAAKKKCGSVFLPCK